MNLFYVGFLGIFVILIYLYCITTVLFKYLLLPSMQCYITINKILFYSFFTFILCFHIFFVIIYKYIKYNFGYIGTYPNYKIFT